MIYDWEIPNPEPCVALSMAEMLKGGDATIYALYVVDLVNYQRCIITIQIAFFDIDTGETLLVKRARGEMKGFSIRNYYAGGIYCVIKESANTYKTGRKRVRNNSFFCGK